MSNPFRWEIYWYSVPYRDNPEVSKKRPILIIDGKEAISLSYQMTSNLKRRHELEYKLKDWAQEGLDKPTVVRIGYKILINNDELGAKIGNLTKQDIDAIKALMLKYGLNYSI